MSLFITCNQFFGKPIACIKSNDIRMQIIEQVSIISVIARCGWCSGLVCCSVNNVYQISCDIAHHLSLLPLASNSIAGFRARSHCPGRWFAISNWKSRASFRWRRIPASTTGIRTTISWCTTTTTGSVWCCSCRASASSSAECSGRSGKRAIWSCWSKTWIRPSWSETKGTDDRSPSPTFCTSVVSICSPMRSASSTARYSTYSTSSCRSI